MAIQKNEKRYIKPLIKEFIIVSAKYLNDRGASKKEYQAYFNGASNLFDNLMSSGTVKCSKTFNELYEEATMTNYAWRKRNEKQRKVSQ